MRSVCLMLLVLAGCDNIFRLSPVPEPPVDGNPNDGISADVDFGVDAFLPGCGPGHIADGDYDLDGRPNNTDLCPQLANAQVDSDNDGVGDQCDRHPSTPGDCMVILDDFATLDCWHTYEAWQTCPNNRPCTPLGEATIDLRNGLSLDTAEIRGSFVQIAANGPSLALILNDSQPLAPVSGTACEARQFVGYMGTSQTIYANNSATANNTLTNSPMQVTSEVPMDVVLAWSTQFQASPNYLCASYTKTSTIGLSSATQNALTAPNGSQPVVRTVNTVFAPSAFIGYGVGNQCASDQ